jgi:hypothetical protein
VRGSCWVFGWALNGPEAQDGFSISRRNFCSALKKKKGKICIHLRLGVYQGGNPILPDKNLYVKGLLFFHETGFGGDQFDLYETKRAIETKA